MSDDALIAGAAAPQRRRLIRSQVVLDAVWVVSVSGLVLVSAFVPLIELPTARLETGAAPLRVFVVGLPLVAIGLAIVSVVRRSPAWVASATGTLSPAVALAGSLSVSLFLSDASAFADVGVAVSLGAAVVGVVMLVRWFVYHPSPLLDTAPRPVSTLAVTLSAIGGLLASVVIVNTFVVGDTPWTIATASQAIGMLVVLATLAGAAVARTVESMWLAASASAAQVFAVVILAVDGSDVDLAAGFALGTGPVGLVVLVAAATVAVLAVRRTVVDETPGGLDEPDDASWRWTVEE